MKGNSFGRLFRITTWGESHGPSMGVVIDGCPSGIPLHQELFIADLALRQGGQTAFTTARREVDEVIIESGVFAGETTGTPITLRIVNSAVRSEDYEDFRLVPRPGHADITTLWKQGVRDHRGGGRASARETVARVVAGVVAKQILTRFGSDCLAFVRRIGDLAVPFELVPFHQATSEYIEGELWESVRRQRSLNNLRLPLANVQAFQEKVDRVKAEKNSLGGAVECWVKGLPRGLGEPTFEKLPALLAQALMSLPAAVAVESGGGWLMSQEPGSAIRDPIEAKAEEIELSSASPRGNTVDRVRVGANRHGGLLGGMTTGEPLWCSVHFHAPTSIAQPCASVDLNTGKPVDVVVEGRHDSFPLPRAVPMVEAMVAIVLADALLLAKTDHL